MSFELLSVPDRYSTDVALIVAPYVDVKFMNQVVERMKPRRLCLLVDDGIRKEDLVELQASCGKSVRLEIRLGRAKGLVHMKAFFFEFVLDGRRRRRKRRLLLGSANATAAAFSGNTNAELVADVELSISHDPELASYFLGILDTFDAQGEAEVAVQACSVHSNKVPLLHLPGFKSIPVGALPSGFDTWLQRGRLTAKYRDAPQFGMLGIRLKKALPRDQVAQIFANRAFTEQGERDVVRYGYLNDDDTAIEPEPDQPRWKARLSVWTHLGDWVSEECYRENRAIMRSKAADKREAKIGRVVNGHADEQWQKERVTTLINALRRVWRDLQDAGIRPETYLMEHNGKLNPAPYKAQFISKLKQDFNLAQDQDFKNRYIQGYEFPDMPRFRQDTAAWEHFVRSWCESISVEAAKARTLSLLVQRLKKHLEQEGLYLEEMVVTDIALFLRRGWSRTLPESELTLGAWLMDYHLGL